MAFPYYIMLVLVEKLPQMRQARQIEKVVFSRQLKIRQSKFGGCSRRHKARSGRLTHMLDKTQLRAGLPPLQTKKQKHTLDVHVSVRL